MWSASAAFVVSQLLSNPFTSIASYGPIVIILAPAVLIAVGGRLGVAAAAVSASLAGLVTVMFMLMAASSSCNYLFCPPPALIAGTAVLAVASALAAREINRTL